MELTKKQIYKKVKQIYENSPKFFEGISKN